MLAKYRNFARRHPAAWAASFAAFIYVVNTALRWAIAGDANHPVAATMSIVAGVLLWRFRPPR
jgi:hypothetical protein